jgi:hypothetical protein
MDLSDPSLSTQGLPIPVLSLKDYWSLKQKECGYPQRTETPDNCFLQKELLCASPHCSHLTILDKIATVFVLHTCTYIHNDIILLVYLTMYVYEMVFVWFLL